MDGGMLIGLFFIGVTGLFMIILGIVQYRSKEPVGFYSGEEPPKREELTDIDAWNKKHGKMWIIYGILIIISYVVSIPIMDSSLCVIPISGGMLVPIIFIIIYHNKLIKRYKK